MTPRQVLFDWIEQEREEQTANWGLRHDPGDGILLAVLVEEVGEVARCLNAGWPEGYRVAELREELVQVAAVAVQWLEVLERRIEDGR